MRELRPASSAFFVVFLFFVFLCVVLFSDQV